MLNRRDFLRASAVIFAGLTGLVSSSEASTHFDTKPAIPFSHQYTEDLINQIRVYASSRDYYRKAIIITYEEWKDFNRYRESPESSDRNRQINGPHSVEVKALLMTKNPGITLSILTQKEVQEYNSELIMFDPLIDIPEINIKYTLHLSREEFQKKSRSNGFMVNKQAL